MRVSEAKYIRAVLEKIEPTRLSPCFNLGSSTRHFRESLKPHIQEELIAPLEERGIAIIHSDMKVGDGIDVAGDIFKQDTQNSLRSLNIKLLLCCNMMEHVKSPESLADIIDKIMPEGAFLLVSVPYSYPLHMDPIDTYFRPSPEKIAGIFPNFDLVDSSIVESTTYLQDIWYGNSRRKSLVKLLKRLVTAPFPVFGKAEWKRRHHRLFWLFRRYKITCVLLRKRSSF